MSSINNENNKRSLQEVDNSVEITSTLSGSTKKTKVALVCEVCHKELKSAQNLREHMFAFHPADPNNPKLFKCDICNESFATPDSVRKHKAYKHNNKQFACTIDECKEVFPHQQNLYRHVFSVHKQQSYKDSSGNQVDIKVYSCDHIKDGKTCDYKTVDLKSFKDHIKRYSDEKSYVCDLCPAEQQFAGKTADSLLKHKQRIHSNKKYVCNIDDCTREFNDPSSFKRHKDRHNTEKTFKCTYEDGSCKYEYIGTTEANLRNHIRQRHTHRSLTCPECSRVLACESTLRSHMYTHNPGQRPKNSICTWPKCDKKFVSKYDLDKHYRVHTGEKPLKCHLCDDFTCADPGTLRKHIKNHPLEKKFKCWYPLCGFGSNEGMSKVKLHYEAMHSAEGQQRQKKSENNLAKALTERGVFFRREHQIDLSCVKTTGSFARVDFVIEQNGIIHFIENDEQQHHSQQIICECARMVNIYDSLLVTDCNMPIMFWRFNPHFYKKNTVAQNFSLHERVDYLLKMINHQSSLPKEQLLPLTIHYICYNIVNDELEIMQNDEFHDELKPCVVVHDLQTALKQKNID